MPPKVALVAGAGGIIGRGLIDVLRPRSDWTVRPLGRSEAVAADLRDARQTASALKAAADTTHLFYAAYLPQPNLAAEVAVNGPMFENILAGLKAVKAPLQRVVLYQGAKVYGVHLGKVAAPFYEDETPRHLPPNFYYTQEDALRRRADTDGFDWTILRPDVVVGDVAGNPMNIAMVIGVFAAISKATGTPFRFPGPAKVYNQVFAQVTETHLLARASLWTATAETAHNQAFNYVHEPFRWERIWTKVGAALGLEVGPPMTMVLAKHMADQGAVWQKLVAEHGLRDTPYDKLVGWGFGDFIFNCGFDVVSDMGKIRRAGFTDTVDSADAIIAAIRSLQARKVLP
jgi:nucleoside-diphosphate-sugar epimerase